MSYIFYSSLSMPFQNRKEAKKKKKKEKEKTEHTGHTCIVKQNSYSWDTLYLLKKSDMQQVLVVSELQQSSCSIAMTPHSAGRDQIGYCPISVLVG